MAVVSDVADDRSVDDLSDRYGSVHYVAGIAAPLRSDTFKTGSMQIVRAALVGK